MLASERPRRSSPLAGRLGLLAALLPCACAGPQKEPARGAARPAGPATPVPGETAALPVFPDEPFRKQQPAPAPPRPFQLPEVKTFQLAEGVDVYLVATSKLPVVSLELVFEGGDTLDPPPRSGLTSSCMLLLAEGTRKLDKIAYREALADVASSITPFTHTEQHGLAMRSLARHFDTTFALFADTLLQPGLRKADFDRLIKRRIETIRQDKGSPQGVASRLRPSILYGLEHPLGRVPTEKSLGALSLADCKQFYARTLKPKGAKVFVVGAVDEAQIRSAFAARLKAWRGAPRAQVAQPAPAPRQGRVFFVNLPGASQSVISLLGSGPERKAADYPANEVLVAILGRGFTGRINMNLREDKGYAYGAYGGFSYRRQRGEFVTMAQVKAETTRQSILEVLRELEAIRDQRPPGDEELTREKNGLVLALPSRFATAMQTLAQYRDLVYYGLPLDYYNQFVASFEAVDLDQVRTAAQKHIRPGELRILVIGDGATPLIARDDQGSDKPLKDGQGQPVTLRAGLEELAKSPQLGGGELVLLDADGQPVTAAAAAAGAAPARAR